MLTDQKLLEVLLIDGELIGYFKLCATEGRDPLSPRFGGINVLNALLVSEVPLAKKLKDVDGLCKGLHTLTADKVTMFADELILIDLPPRRGAQVPRTPHPIFAMAYLVQQGPGAGFEELWSYLRTRGYSPGIEVLGLLH